MNSSHNNKQNKNSENFPALTFIGSFVDSKKMPNDRIEICMLGRSNSGKSTLIATLSKNPSLVKVSSKPGSTRTINIYGWQNLYLSDLPGYGYAQASRSLRQELSQQITNYLQHRENLAGGFLLLDCKREPKQEEFYLSELFRKRNLPLVLLLTKTDRLNQSQKAALKKRVALLQKDFHLVVEISAHKKNNLSVVFHFLNSFTH